MKLCTFIFEESYKVGLIKDSQVIDLGPEYHGQQGMINFLTDNSISKYIISSEKYSDNPHYELSEVKLTSPVLKPEKFFGVALNYADHIEETGLEKIIFILANYHDQYSK